MCVLKNGVGHITIVIPGKSQGREAFKEHIVHLDDSSHIYILFLNIIFHGWCWSRSIFVWKSGDWFSSLKGWAVLFQALVWVFLIWKCADIAVFSFTAQYSGTASRTRVLGLLTEKVEPGKASVIASHAELPKRRASSGHSGLPDLNFGLPLPLPLSVPSASQPLSFLSSALVPGLPQHKGQVPPMMLDASYIGIFGGRPGRKCRRCGQEFLSQEDFEDHVDFCRRKMLACDYCDMCFRRRFNLKVHLRCRHGIGEQLVCPACGLNFRSKVRLLRHDCAASKKERSEDA